MEKPPHVLFRYYMAVLAMLVSSMASVCWFLGPAVAGIWLVVGVGTPLWVGVAVGGVGSLLAWPMGAWLVYSLPRMWRMLAWDTERLVAWRGEHEGTNGHTTTHLKILRFGAGLTEPPNYK